MTSLVYGFSYWSTALPENCWADTGAAAPVVIASAPGIVPMAPAISPAPLWFIPKPVCMAPSRQTVVL